MGYLQELDALQKWIYTTAQLPSYRLAAAPPKLPRPVIVWEAPARSQDRNLGRWQFVNRVTQYGKVYAEDLAQLLDYQERLGLDLAEKVNQLPVYNEVGAAGTVIVGQLREVQLRFDHTDASLDVPLRIEYEATYSRVRNEPPAPTEVYTKVIMPPGMPR